MGSHQNRLEVQQMPEMQRRKLRSGMIKPSDIPDKMKRLIDEKDRKGALGKFAHTAAEVTEKAQHKCEKEMQEQIITFLELKDWYYIRQRMDKRAQLKAGTPDFIICVDRKLDVPHHETGYTGDTEEIRVGAFVAIECKMPGEVPTEEQIKALWKIEDSGGKYLVAYSAKQALEFLKGLAE